MRDLNDEKVYNCFDHYCFCDSISQMKELVCYHLLAVKLSLVLEKINGVEEIKDLEYGSKLLNND